MRRAVLALLLVAACKPGGSSMGDDAGGDDDDDDGPDAGVVDLDPEDCPEPLKQHLLGEYEVGIAPAEWAALEDEFMNWEAREQQGLDPHRTVAVDTLFPMVKRRTIMGTPLTDEEYRRGAHGLLASDGVPVTVTRDSPGFIAQRIVSMIVNIGCSIAQSRPSPSNPAAFASASWAQHASLCAGAGPPQQALAPTRVRG